MSAESYLSSKLQKFSIIDFVFVKSVYVVFSLLIFSLYPKILVIDWWFGLILMLMCAMPLWLHLFSQSGDLHQKMVAYLKSNNPSNQVLLFMSIFFFALIIGSIFPVLTAGAWWIYVAIMIVLAIKPMTVSWIW